jgi:hypothetical protein
MAKKDNTLLYIVGLGGLAYAGYELYKRYGTKKPPVTPTVEPKMDPGQPEQKTTPSTPKAPSKPSDAKIMQLQELMIQWFRGSTIQNVQYGSAEAKGGWGTKSRTALQTLFPKLYATNGDITPSNIDMYIRVMKENLEKRTIQEKEQKTKQASANELQKLVSRLVNLNVTGRRNLKVLVPFTGVKHKFDKARNTYIALGDTKQFSKNQIISAGMTIDRGNGQILIKGDKDFVYPTNPNNLYVE